MNSCPIKAGAAKALGSFLSRLPALTEIDFHKVKYGLFTAEGLANLIQGLNGATLAVRDISLLYCDIPEDAGRSLGELLRLMPNLQKLNFGKHDKLFTANGFHGIVEGLGDLKELPTQDLEMATASISPEAGLPLGQILGRMTNLRVLSMVSTSALDLDMTSPDSTFFFSKQGCRKVKCSRGNSIVCSGPKKFLSMLAIRNFML